MRYVFVLLFEMYYAGMWSGLHCNMFNANMLQAYLRNVYTMLLVRKQRM